MTSTDSYSGGLFHKKKKTQEESERTLFCTTWCFRSSRNIVRSQLYRRPHHVAYDATQNAQPRQWHAYLATQAKTKWHNPTLWCLRSSTDHLRPSVGRGRHNSCTVPLHRNGPLAVATQRWQRRVALAARANACWEHRWSAQKERKSAEGGRRRVWELMLAADVCHSSLSVVTHSLALYQAHSRRSCCSLCALGADI